MTTKPVPETFLPNQSSTYSPPEREQMLAMMRETSNAFYKRARLIGCHPFIEFAGLMNEYIKVCRRAHEQGIDFTESSAHSGKPLDFRSYEAAYLGEKLGCIYGPSLQAPENLRAFLRAAGLNYAAVIQAAPVEGLE